MLGQKHILSREGGVVVVVKELSTRMVKIGHSVTCYNRHGHHVSGKEFDCDELKEYDGVKLKYVPTFNKRGLAAMTSSFFAAIICSFGKYDVVHFHSEGPCAMLWLPKLFGKRCIATIHGLDHMRAKWGKFAKWYIMIGEKCAVKYADEIIVLSESVRNYFLEKYNRETIFIPNGITKPEKKDTEVINYLFNIKKDDYILFLGRIVPEKGLKYLVTAFKKVKTDKKLIIAGGSSDTDEFFMELKKDASEDKRIIFSGFTQGKLLEEFYSNAYIYTLPSDLEGMPISLLEAMSYGNCCLVSDIPECADVIGDYGVTFKAGDVEDLTRNLQYLCDNPNIVNEYKSKVSEFVCERYNWDEIVDKTIQLYSDGLGERYDKSITNC